jgi:energy-coupling factor transporter ATP-binding protein EcfA2
MQPADIYLIDEPSAYLDSEQRIVASKVIKRFILHAKKTAFVVEHDFIMATYLADRVIVYEGKPSIDCVANCPQSLLTGMNLFLSVSLTAAFLVCLSLSLSTPSSSFSRSFFLFQLQSIKNQHWVGGGFGYVGLYNENRREWLGELELNLKFSNS